MVAVFSRKLLRGQVVESYTDKGQWQGDAQPNGTSSSNELYEWAGAGSILITDTNTTYTQSQNEESGGKDPIYHANARCRTPGITVDEEVAEFILYDASINTISP